MKFKDAEALNAVYHATNPTMTARQWEKEHRRADWGMMVVDAMKYCLVKKYQQCSVFRNELERSKGLFIVEDQTTSPKSYPDAWGVKPQGDCFVGPNLLGRLLMELRDHHELCYRIPNTCYNLPDDALDFIKIIKAQEERMEASRKEITMSLLDEEPSTNMESLAKKMKIERHINKHRNLIHEQREYVLQKELEEWKQKAIEAEGSFEYYLLVSKITELEALVAEYDEKKSH